MFPSRVSRNTQCLVRFRDCMLRTGTGSDAAAVFARPIEKFDVYSPNDSGLPSKWTITGSQKTPFLNAVAMKYLPAPPLSRTYPFAAASQRYDSIEYLNFRDASGLDKVYLSARYETFAYKGKLEMDDDVNSVRNYVTGANNYNSSHRNDDAAYLSELLSMFNLEHLASKWINSLSNGQMRRARIAKSLVHKPRLLIVDDPFLGLDPIQTKLVSEALESVCGQLNTSIVLGLRLQDEIPSWITHVGEATPDGLVQAGKKEVVMPLISQDIVKNQPVKRQATLAPLTDDLGEPLHLEFTNASVKYRDLYVLKNFTWKVPRGSRWRIMGDNGTGKTTILSLITADHPQSWKSVLKIDGVLRKTGSGVSFFDVNNRIGISSPELHALVPGYELTMNQVIKTGLVMNVGNSNFKYSGETCAVPGKTARVFKQFDDVLAQYGNTKFAELSLTHQKLALFLRAVAKDPELLILDEAFSCMDDPRLMHECHEVLRRDYADTTVLSIGHIEWELPEYRYVLQLTGDKDRSYRLQQVQQSTT